MYSDTAMEPTFTYRGEYYLWGYSPDRQLCGMWEAGDSSGPPTRSWPISEHAEAWGIFRSIEPHAVAFDPLGAPAGPAGAVRPSSPSPALSAPVTSTLVLERPPAQAGTEAPVSSAASETWTDLNTGTYVAAIQAPSGSVVDARERRRRLLLVAALCVVLVLAAVVGVRKLLPKSATITPAQAVLTAASSTESLHSARVSIVETLTDHAESKTVSIPATGEVDFSSGGARLDMTISGQQVSVVSSQGALYMSTPAVSKAVPGKSWVSVPLSNASSTEGGALGGADPTQMLQILASQGNVVSPLGPSTIDGVSVQGYSVLVNKSVVETDLESSGAPPALVQSAEQVLKSVGEIIFKAYVDSNNQLKAMDYSMEVPGASGVMLFAQATFSDYGAPVAVTPPPASQVVSFEQFLAAVA